MKRRIFNAIAVLSAVLCVAVCFVWVRGSNVAVGYGFGRSDGRGQSFDLCAIDRTAFAGTMIVKPFTEDGITEIPKGEFYTDTRMDLGFVYAATCVNFGRRCGGFYYVIGGAGDPRIYRAYAVGAPLWFCALLTTVIPLARACRWLAERPKRNSSTCSNCGYDLRATPDRCPECGLVPEKKKAAQS